MERVIVMNNTHFIDQLSHVNMIETLYLNSNDLKPSMNLFLNLLFKRLLLEYYVYIRTIYNKYACLETPFLSFQLFPIIFMIYVISCIHSSIRKI